MNIKNKKVVSEWYTDVPDEELEKVLADADADSSERKAPNKRRKRSRQFFAPNMPWQWVEITRQFPPRTFTLACALWHTRMFDGDTFKIERRHYERFGLTDPQYRRALADLEELSLVTVDRSSVRPVVTIHAKPVTDDGGHVDVVRMRPTYNGGCG